MSRTCPGQVGSGQRYQQCSGQPRQHFKKKKKHEGDDTEAKALNRQMKAAYIKDLSEPAVAWRDTSQSRARHDHVRDLCRVSLHTRSVFFPRDTLPVFKVSVERLDTLALSSLPTRLPYRFYVFPSFLSFLLPFCFFLAASRSLPYLCRLYMLLSLTTVYIPPPASCLGVRDE